MINVKLIIKNISKNKFSKIIISIEIHLGKNPRKGGKPPKDNKGIEIINFCILDFKERENIWLRLNILKLLNIKIIEIDKKK